MSSIKLKGDTSGEITIDAPAVSGTNTLTLPAETGTLVTQNALGVRNIIINGDMKIAQRGTTPTTGNEYLIDRWKQVRVLSSIAVEMSQSTDVPTAQGFCNSIKLNVTSAGALSAGNYHRIDQKIEGQNIQYIKWGTASPEKLTLSFWVKSNYTGNFQASLNPASGAVNSIGFTVNSADTWEKKIITFTDTTTTAPMANDNTAQLSLYFYTAVGTSTFTETLNNYINITGVQLEVGDTATPFEHRPYDMELARCQRYYQVIDAGVNAYSPTGIIGFPFNTAMRAAPTLTFSFSGIANRVYRIDTGGTFDLTVAATNLTDKSFVSLFATSPANWAGTHGVGFRSTFAFSAEL